MIRKTSYFFIFLAFVGLSAVTLAWVGEVYFNLPPCQLCLYQRYLYIALAAWCVSCVLFLKYFKSMMVPFMGSASLLLGQAMVAFYHVGIEKKIFDLPSTCQSFVKTTTNITKMTQALLSQPISRCDIVPWTFLGISMAGYNALFALALFAMTIGAFYSFNRQKT